MKKSFLFIPGKRGIAWLFILAMLATGAVAQEKPSPKEKPAAQEKPIVLEDFIDLPGNETFPAGIVHGPKAAFSIRAPKGWVLDNQAGVQQGLPCVLYPEGSTWANADAVMYAKIASTDTKDRDEFVKAAIAHMQEGNEGFKSERVASGKTGDGHAYVINDYRHGARAGANNSMFERVAYVQLPDAVAYLVFTVPTKALHKKHARAVDATMKTFSYQPKYINFGVEKKAPK